MSKLDRLARRHGTGRWRALASEAFVRAYQRAWLRRLLRAPYRAQEPRGWIFMGGSYNAGTTIVKNAILAHPQLAGMPVEGDILSGAFPDLERGGFPRGMYANRELIEAERAQGRLDSEAIRSDWAPWVVKEKYFLDKAIAHTVRIPQLRAAFPGARFVGVVRHPEDVAAGIRKRSRPASGGEYELSFLHDQWRYFYRTLLRDAGEDTVLVSYEAFIESPAAQLAEVFAALELPVPALAWDGERLQVGARSLNIRPLPVARPLFPSARAQIEHFLSEDQPGEEAP
ncbi:MAG: hypothetical protein CMJ94_13460 [Planctomycetes bacterium]|nr:hypothetical protein [Planctomycetota bacterium]